MTFNDNSKFIYIPRQHIVYFNEKESIWLFDLCPVFYNNEGDNVFAGESVKLIDDRIEIDLNAHYQFNENGVIQKLVDTSIESFGFTENLYLTPAPFVSHYVSGQIPNDLKIENITVCFPIRSQLGDLPMQTIRFGDNRTSSLAHRDPATDSRPLFSTKKSESSLGEKPTLQAASSGGANPILARKLQKGSSIQSSRLATEYQSARQIPHVANRVRSGFRAAPRQLATNYPRARIPTIPTRLGFPFFEGAQPIMPPPGSSLPATMTVCLIGFHIRKNDVWICDAYSSIIFINH